MNLFTVNKGLNIDKKKMQEFNAAAQNVINNLRGGEPAAVNKQPSLPKKSAFQSLQTVKEPEKTWYKGKDPTSSEILAQIYTIGKSDPKRSQQLFADYERFTKDPTSPIYNPYTGVTNNAVKEIANLGIDVSGGINDEWFEANSWLKQYYRLGTSGSPLAPSNGSSAEQDAAYWMSKIFDAEETTKKAENEWAALQEELSYWATRADRNYSDEEILAKVNWNNYKTLTAMDAAKGEGLSIALNRPVGYSKDAMTGVIWGARNGDNGNPLTNSAKAVLGQGKGYVRNEKIADKLNPKSENYNPYSVGSTIDEAALYFGESSFDAKWIEDNIGYRGSDDLTAKKQYAAVIEAEQNTQKAEAELERLHTFIDGQLMVSSDVDDVLSDVKDYLEGEYWDDEPALSMLMKMDKSLKSGVDLIATTRAIDYRWEDIEADIRRRCAEMNNAQKPEENVRQFMEMYSEPIGPSTPPEMGNKIATAGATDASTPAPVILESEVAIKATKDNNINAAGTLIAKHGTPEEKIVFQTGYDSSSPTLVGKLVDFVRNNPITPEKASEYLVGRADKYTIENYPAAFETILDYSAAEEKLLPQIERAEKEVAELERRLEAAGDSPMSGKYAGYTPDQKSAADSYIYAYMDNADMADYINELYAAFEGNREEADAFMQDMTFALGNGRLSDNEISSWFNGAERLTEEERQAIPRLIEEKKNTISGYRSELEQLRPEYEASLAVQKEAERRYDMAQNATGITETGSKYFTNAMDIIQFLGEVGNAYQTNYTAYTEAQQLAEQGMDASAIQAVGAERIRQNNDAIEYIDAAISWAEENGVQLGVVEKAQKEKERLLRENKDWEYAALQNEGNFDSVVADIKKTIDDLPATYTYGRYGSEYSQMDYDIANNGYIGHRMTDDEKDTYLYIRATKGTEAAEEYYNHLYDEDYGVMPVRSAEVNTELMQDWAHESPVFSTLATILTNPLQMLGTAYSTMQLVKGEQINPYSHWFAIGNMSSDVRSTVKEDIEKTVGEGTFLSDALNVMYDAATSAGDSFVNAKLFGFLGSGIESKFAASFVSSVPMGFSAAGNTMQDVAERGGTPEQIAIMGLTTFLSETLTEAVTYENIVNAKNLGNAGAFKESLGEIVKDMFLEEGVGEALSEGISALSDEMVMGELSNYNTMVDNYVDSGMDLESARKQATKDIVNGIFMAYITGAVSSGFSGTVSYMQGRIEKGKYKPSDGVETKGEETVAEEAEAPTEATETPQEAFVPVHEQEGYVDRFDRPEQADQEVTQTDVDVAMNNVLALQNSLEADEASQTIAMASALTPENAAGETVRAATSAAQHLGNMLGTAKAAEVMSNVLSVAKDNVDAVQVAFVVAAHGDGEATRLLKGFAANSEFIGPESVAKFVEYAQAEMQNPTAMTQVEQKITDNAVANKEKEIVSAGALAGLRSQQDGLKQSKRNLINAKGALAQTVTRFNAAQQNLKSVHEQYIQDPTNAQLSGLVDHAIKELDGMRKMVEEYTKARDNAQASYDNAKKALNTQQDAEMTKVREQAQQEVAAEVAAEEQLKAEAKAQADQQRQIDNVTEMETENFMAENGYDSNNEADRAEVGNAMKISAQTVDNVRFASQVSKRFGVKIRLTDSNAVEGVFDAGTDTIVVSKEATQSDVLKRVLAHELTHRTEGTKAYGELANVLLEMAYHGDTAKMEADLNAIYQQYKDAYGKEQGDAIYTEELIAHVAGDLLSDTDAISRIVADKPSAARRMLDTIRNFINRIKGVNDPFVDQLRKVEKLMTKALEESDRKYRKSLSDMGIEVVDGNAVKYSLSSWTESERNTARQSLLALGHDEATVDKWLNDVDSVAATIAADQERLDFDPAEEHTMLKSNQEYVKTLDASTLCAKRLLYQGTFNAIQHALPNTVLTSDDLIDLRNMMAEAGEETPCIVCYVESRRRNLGVFADKWLQSYKGEYMPTLADVTTTDGLENMRKNHPEVYKSFTDAMKKKGSNNPKVVELRTNYRGEIKKLSTQAIKKITDIGGLRVQSFSDFETPHLLDMMQAVLDMSSMGLTSQAYTKVPNFAAVFGDTGIKINLSLLSEGTGLDENGNLVFSSYEGMDFDKAMNLRSRYSKNVGTILVGISDAHIRAAMADPRIDFIIPYHRSGWGAEQMRRLSNGQQEPTDYQDYQNERRIDGYHKNGKPKYVSAGGNFHPVGPDGYWDFSKTGKENAEIYLRMCAEDGRVPKFEQFLHDNGDGSYSLPEDGSADGYWKMLIDFKMYDNDGVGAPQDVVKPVFNMEEAMRVLAEYEGGANELPVAQSVVDKFVAQKKNGLKYYLGASGKENAGEQYSYQYLTSLPDMKISKMPNQNEFFKSERVSDRKLSSELGITNAKSKDGTISTSRHIFVNNTYSGIPIQINESGLRHGINGARDRRARNSAAAVIAGDLIENAVPINELEKKDGEKPYVKRVFLYVGMAEDENNFYPVGMVVKSTEEDLGELSGIEAFEGVDKRYLYSLNAASENKKGTAYEGMAVSDTTSSGSSISISDLLELVKNKFGDGFSSDVLNNLGIERPEGQYGKNAKYALPSSSLLNYQINNWRNGSEQQDAEPQPRQRERQFAGQTMPNSNAPGEAVQALLNDPQQLYYTPTTNREQVNAAYTRIQDEGFDAAVERVLNLEKMNASDNADAYTLLAMAKDMGDVPTFIELARKVNVEGTEQGRTLQIRTLLKRMTPTGIQVWAAGKAESGLADWMAKNQPAMKAINQRAEEVADAVRDMDSRDATEQLLALSDATITPDDAHWGQPVNEQQRELIRQYKLEKVRRPGINYNRATTKQRMLEAILATPNALEMTGNGLNLIQRLELLKRGEEVITVADLRYIAGNMESFMALEDEDSRQADIYLSRIYETYGNITPVTKRERRRTWRYTSMLLSLPSAGRNIIGNALQNVDNAVAHGVATVIDKGVSKITGERTTATISMQDRAEGWQQFVEETKNTFRDYFVDKAVTRRGEDRFNTNQRGRVFQNRLGETMRLVEGYLMTVGDRNFWKKAYFNSIAEQRRVAELNGVEFNIEQALDRAEQEANYATFNEDGRIRDAFQGLKQSIPMLDYIIPFTGTPTNIIRRMYQFTPFSLATNMVKHAARAMRGENFDQYQFVNDMSRGLVGSMKFAGGMALAMFGIIKMGTGDEEDEKVAGVESAQGKPYSFYITLGDQNYDLSVLAPVASPLIMGAAAHEIFKNDENALNALYSAAIAMSDQIFEASYMSGVKSMFQGYGSPTENIVSTLASNIVGQNIPAFLGQIASALDPYVRDTKDKNFIMQTLKSGLINKIPLLRNELPEKVDVAGRAIENTDQYVALVDPFNRNAVVEDPTLDELMRLYEELGTSSFMPSDYLSGKKNSFTGYDGSLDDEQKETYKKRYGELWRLGGKTVDSNGNPVTIQGMDSLIKTDAYKNMTDAEKANALTGIMEAARDGAKQEAIYAAGLTKKKEADDKVTKKTTRAMPEQFVGRTDGYFGKLAEMYEQTGDGAFIPKTVDRKFTNGGIDYNLTDKEYEKFLNHYEKELTKRLSDKKNVNWNASPEEVAAAVEKQYTNAASATKKAWREGRVK